jgi:hypothetical protein
LPSIRKTRKAASGLASAGPAVVAAVFSEAISLRQEARSNQAVRALLDECGRALDEPALA